MDSFYFFLNKSILFSFLLFLLNLVSKGLPALSSEMPVRGGLCPDSRFSEKGALIDPVWVSLHPGGESYSERCMRTEFWEARGRVF